MQKKCTFGWDFIVVHVERSLPHRYLIDNYTKRVDVAFLCTLRRWILHAQQFRCRPKHTCDKSFLWIFHCRHNMGIFSYLKFAKSVSNSINYSRCRNIPTVIIQLWIPNMVTYSSNVHSYRSTVSLRRWLFAALNAIQNRPLSAQTASRPHNWTISNCRENVCRWCAKNACPASNQIMNETFLRWAMSKQ